MPEIERKGECNHCGWCCQFVAIHPSTIRAQDQDGNPTELAPDDARFYQLRHGALAPDRRSVRLVIHHFSPCSEHDEKAQRCKDYDNRPNACRTFPQTPEQIEGTPCSYYFEKKLEDGTIARRGGLGSPYPTAPVFK